MQARAASQAALSDQLAALESAASQAAGQFVSLAGGNDPTIADVAVVCALQPLFSSVLSAQARSAYPGLAQWVQSAAVLPAVSPVLGG
jgi:glutathione S-transferase